jgi:hypothetical protein
VPAVPPGPRVRNAVDAFLAAEQDKRGLVPVGEVAKELWLRRVRIDLTGLPPTRAEVHAFLADDSDDAYERVVDRLLASPQYGERWARHWMDVWRYSDPDGRKAKGDIWWGNEHIWRWRDWIVASLNADKGYDRMVLEMLAGDEIALGDPEALAATGFLVRNWFKLSRNIWLNTTVEHTAKAFLGLTLQCARCHDHKFDPISQKEYYQFRAFFEPHDIRIEELPVGAGGRATIVSTFDAHPDDPTWLYVRGNERAPDQATALAPGVPAALATAPVTPQPVLGRGTPSGLSTGRRLALARWLGDRQNPLTARVAVNHVWMRHFGQPLVDPVTDFGLRTPPPAQQALLDWLAVELMDHQWSMKWLHRLLVTSAAYRLDCSLRAASAATVAADPENRFLWHGNPRRLEAEAVRDALLYLGGDIDLTLGGPPLDCLDGCTSARRSLYHRYSREDKLEFLTAFDAASVDECYRRQESIVPQQALALENSEFVWDQARRVARRLEAEGGPPPGASSPAFIRAAFEQVLGRGPSAQELEECEQFLADQERLLSAPAWLTPFPALPAKKAIPQEGAFPGVVGVARKLPPMPPARDPRGRAREALVHALFNHNDFLTVR